MNKLNKYPEKIDSNFTKLNKLNNELNNLSTSSLDIWIGYKTLMSKISEIQTSEQTKNNSSEQEVPTHSEYQDVEADKASFCKKNEKQK